MRLFDRRIVGDGGGIEQHQIGPHSGADDAAVRDADVRRGERRHLAHGLLEREHPLLAHVAAEHAWERAEAARMRAIELSVAAEIRERPAEDRADVALVHASRDNAFVGGFRLRLRDQGHQRRRRIAAAETRDLADVLADVRRVERIVADDEIFRCRNLAQNEIRLGAVVEVALRVQDRERRLPHRVRVHVGRDLHTRAARAVERRDESVALTPERPHRELHMRDLHGHACDASDREQLVERLPELAVLAAHVTDVAAANGADFLRQLEDLATRGVNTRVVFQPRREAKRSRGHLLAHERAHARHLRVGRSASVVVADDPAADGAMPDVRRHVDRRGLRIDPRKETSEGEGRAAVLAGHDSGDPL